MAAKSHDPHEVASTLWHKTALPSILYGAEVAGFTKKHIEDLESVQARVAAFVLGVHNTYAHVGILTEVGWPSITSQIYKMKMRYFHRLLHLKQQTLVKAVFDECWDENVTSQLQNNIEEEIFILQEKNLIENEVTANLYQTKNLHMKLKKHWKSNYEHEIHEIINKCELLVKETGKKGKKQIEAQISQWDFRDKKLKIEGKTSLKWQPKKFLYEGKQPYLNGSQESKIITNFRLGNGIEQVDKKDSLCPLCYDAKGNNEAHLVMTCPNTKEARKSCGLDEWIQSQNTFLTEDEKLRKLLGDDGSLPKQILDRATKLETFLEIRKEKCKLMNSQTINE